MSNLKRYGIAGATMATILLTGQVMQMTATDKRAKVAAIQASALPVKISDIKLTSAESDEPVVLAALDPNNSTALPPTQTKPNTSNGCEISMTSEPKAAALVDISLNAACLPNERVVIHHNGMMFSETTDGRGALNITVPALAETAVFIASFSSGEGAVTNATVETLELYDRAVVQTRDTGGISLHARERASEYGSKGHIWSENSGSIADAVTGRTGFMVQLGDKSLENSLFAEVYSYPTALAKDTSEIVLSVDIEITNTNCNQDIEAQTLQVSRAGKISVQNLDMSMPDCDAVGDFLVLNNLVNNMKVASN